MRRANSWRRWSRPPRRATARWRPRRLAPAAPRGSAPQVAHAEPRRGRRAMAPPAEQALALEVDARHSVSGLLIVPARASACYVLAHGAGAGMTQPAMRSVAVELAERGIATLRYQFPYMEQGSKRLDPPALCHATVRAA